MRLRAIANNGVVLESQYKERGYGDHYIAPVKVNSPYVVYGMILWYAKMWYLIVGEESSIPTFVPASLFDVIDGRLSRHWFYTLNRQAQQESPECIWGYRELAGHMGHFDELVGREPNAQKIFDVYKQKLDIEFAWPEVTKRADLVESDWVICSQCHDGWQGDPYDEMTVCPSCGTMLLNPLKSGLGKQIE